MFGTSPESLVRVIANNHRALGLELPSELSKAESDVAKLTQDGGRLGAPRGALTRAVADAILGDRDPSSDPDVVRLLVATQLGNDGIINEIREEAKARLVSAISHNAENLIEQWRAPFDKAANTLDKASTYLNEADLDADATQLLNQGGDIAKHYVDARDANNVIETILASWYTLSLVARHASLNREFRLLILSPIPLDKWEEHRLRGAKLSAWELHKLGLKLDLASGAEFEARVQALEMARARRDQEQAAAARGQYKLNLVGGTR
jgi:hypothetical protein